MKKIIYLLIITAFLSCSKKSSKINSELDKFHSYTGQWELPEDFKPLDEQTLKTNTSGTYTSIKIPGTDLVAGVCPRYNKDDQSKKIIYCNIDIEMPTKDGDYVVTELEVPAQYISRKHETLNAENIISIEGNLVKFNLGKKVFKCKIQVTKK